MRVAVTGATGLIGSALCRELQSLGHEAVALVRDPQKVVRMGLSVETATWSDLTEPPPQESLDGIDAVVHLAGASIAGGRWNRRRKEQIRDSRVKGTNRLVEAIGACSSPPPVLISGSAVGYYGGRGDEVLDEESQAGTGFLSEVSAQWESEGLRAAQFGVRVVALRTGMVLAREGGALPKMLTPFKLGVGGRLGSGRQWISWIHIQDEIGVIIRALEDSRFSGPVNAVAPEPVTNREFTSRLAQALRRPAVIPVPAVALRLLLGEMADHLLLEGQRVMPRKLQAMEYGFRFPSLAEALEDLLS